MGIASTVMPAVYSSVPVRQWATQHRHMAAERGQVVSTFPQHIGELPRFLDEAAMAAVNSTAWMPSRSPNARAAVRCAGWPRELAPMPRTTRVLAELSGAAELQDGLLSSALRCGQAWPRLASTRCVSSAARSACVSPSFERRIVSRASS
jgi:hypothetical protein